MSALKTTNLGMYCLYYNVFFRIFFQFCIQITAEQQFIMAVKTKAILGGQTTNYETLTGANSAVSTVALFGERRTQ